MVCRAAAERGPRQARSRGRTSASASTSTSDRLPLDQTDPDAVAGEVHGQLDRFHALVGRGPTHLDSHRHLHLHRAAPLRAPGPRVGPRDPAAAHERGALLGRVLGADRGRRPAARRAAAREPRGAAAPAPRRRARARLPPRLRLRARVVVRVRARAGAADALRPEALAVLAEERIAPRLVRGAPRTPRRLERPGARPRARADRFRQGTRRWPSRPPGRPRARSRPTSCACSTRTGAPRTTSPSGRSTCSTTRSCASRSRPEHVKPRLLGHFGTTPGLNLVYAHLNRAIRARDLSAIYVTGPGHGGPGLVANAYLEGTYSEVYPHVGRGRGRAARALPPVLVPGRHPEPRRARDAGLDPRGRRARLRARARVRRRVRQPGPPRRVRRRRRRGRDRARSRRAGTRTSSSTRARDGAVLPILHLNGYKIANPTVLARIPRGRARRAASRATASGRSSSRATSREPVHQRVRGRARRGARRDRARSSARPARTATSAPALADDRPAHAEGLDRARRRSTACRSRARGARTRCRSPTCASNPSTCALLEEWMRSYRPEELFDERRRARRRARRARAARRAAHEREPARERRRCCCATSSCPTSATTPSRSSGPATTIERGDARARRASCATSIARNPRDVPPLRARRDRVEPPRRRLRGRPTAPWEAEIAADRRGPRARRAA